MASGQARPDVVAQFSHASTTAQGRLLRAMDRPSKNGETPIQPPAPAFQPSATVQKRPTLRRINERTTSSLLD